MHLAMWSGPRNLSTALMRSFSQRADAIVVDEPLYAPFLVGTGIEHPGGDEVLADYENDWRVVVDALRAPLPEGKTLYYQKHLTHHLLPDMARDWIDDLTNAFLIRDPARMIASYARVREAPTLQDLGPPQQLEIFERERERLGRTPPVIDAADLLRDPRGMLTKLCDAVGIEFDEAMLSWPKGPHPSDGNWGCHWYGSIWNSTGWGPATTKEVTIPPQLEQLHADCREVYEQLHPHRLH